MGRPNSPPGQRPRAGPAPASSFHLPGKLAHWPVERLRPYERNPRAHSPEQVTKIAGSLLEFGWTNPPLLGLREVGYELHHLLADETAAGAPASEPSESPIA